MWMISPYADTPLFSTTAWEGGKNILLRGRGEFRLLVFAIFSLLVSFSCLVGPLINFNKMEDNLPKKDKLKIEDDLKWRCPKIGQEREGGLLLCQIIFLIATLKPEDLFVFSQHSNYTMVYIPPNYLAVTDYGVYYLVVTANRDAEGHEQYWSVVTSLQ